MFHFSLLLSELLAPLCAAAEEPTIGHEYDFVVSYGSMRTPAPSVLPETLLLAVSADESEKMDATLGGTLPGANRQGEATEEAKENLREAVETRASSKQSLATPK